MESITEMIEREYLIGEIEDYIELAPLTALQQLEEYIKNISSRCSTDNK